MSITMVKKRLANGDPCAKCVQAEELLKNRGLWDRIDRVVWAEEGNPDSAGMRMAAEHGIEVAPFFVVDDDSASPRVYASALQFIKKELATGAAPKAAATADIDVDQAARELADRQPPEIVRWALERFGGRCAVAFSGAEDVVTIDMASKTGLDFSVFTLDTGRLHAETYRFIEKVRSHYGVEIELAFPKPELVTDLVRKKGLFSFLEDGHEECCGIRKVEPLSRALKGRAVWITGQRQDQSPATRADIEVVELDQKHRSGDRPLIKLNPLARWTSDQVWAYLRENDVPYNELHEKGYKSIGCEPCTRAILPGEHERAGRWWWEEATKRECGLHVAKGPDRT